MTKGILSIQLSQLDEDEEPVIVSDHKHILDFVKNADKQFFNKVQKHLEGEREKFAIKPLTAEATPEEIEKGVPATYEVPITFDQSNFFE